MIVMKDRRTGKTEFYTWKDIFIQTLSVVIAFTLVFGTLALIFYFIKD